jgi:hypothetical protein
MTGLTAISPETTAHGALGLLEQAGWHRIGAGDWSWVLVDTSGAFVARVTPFDPAYRMYAEACLNGPPVRWLPHVTNIIPLRREGYIVVMERLWPANPNAASAFCAALGIRCDSGDVVDSTEPFDWADDPDLMYVRTLVLRLMAEGAHRFKLWGGSDIRPANVMVDGRGQLKLVDPIFLRGQAIVAALRGGRRNLLTDFCRCQLEDFLTVPFFDDDGVSGELRRQIAVLYG